MKKQQQVTSKEATYRFVIDRKKKILRCFASGRFTKAEARAYIREFIRLIRTIKDIENYILIIDVHEQEECTDDVNSCITEITTLYSSIPFKKVLCYQSDDPYAFKQITEHADIRFIGTFRLASNANNIEIVEQQALHTLSQVNKEEILNLKTIIDSIFDIATHE